MSRRAFRILTMLCLTIGLLLTLATSANAVDLTTDYYVSGSPGAYSVSTSGGTEIGTGYTTLAEALSACSSDWGGRLFTPEIKLGSSSSPLSVKRGDGALISATYTGAVNIEYSAAKTDGLTVAADVTAELRDFTLTNSVNADDSYAYSAIRVASGGTLVVEDGTNIAVAKGTGIKSSGGQVCALSNQGITTIRGTVALSITDGSHVIHNAGTCAIGGNAGDSIDISTSPSNGAGIWNSGELTIGEGTEVNGRTGLLNYHATTISGGKIKATSRCIENCSGALDFTGGTIEQSGSENTALKNHSLGTFTMKGGTLVNLGAEGYACRALDNDGTATISGGTITSAGTGTIYTNNQLTLTGDCNVVCTNPGASTVVDSGTSTVAGSKIVIEGNASITGGSNGVIASKSGSGGSSTLTITGGTISAGASAVETSADTLISGGCLSASASGGPPAVAFRCFGGGTATISGGEFSAEGDYAYGVQNNASTINFTDGSVVATSRPASSGIKVYGVYNYNGASTTVSGGSIAAKADVSLPYRQIYGVYNNDAIASITGGTISSECTNDMACAVFDEVSVYPKGVFISDTPVLKSATADVIRLAKRTSDSRALDYFGTSFFTSANATVAVQGIYDETDAAYVIDSTNYAGAQARALPDTGYRFTRWTSDAARTNILSETSPASLSTLTADGNASVYFSVKQVFTVTVNQGSRGTARADVASATEGDMVTLTATPHYGYSFARWTSASGVTFADDTASSTTFTMPANDVTVTASWVPNEYTVTFDPDGGTVDEPGTKTVTYGSMYGVLPTPEKTGFTFGGWWTGVGGTGSRIADATNVAITAAQTLYAKWTANAYTLTFDSNGGSVTADIKAAYGDSLTLPTPTRTNYAFNGWYESETDDNGSGTQFSATAMPDLGASGTTKTLYASWTAKTEIGYVPAPQSYTYGTSGAAYTVSYSPLTGFAVEYYAGSAWTATPPTAVGSYDVRITRAEDATHASYASGTLSNHFVITNASQPVANVTIDYAAETLGTTALMEYSANGTDWTDCTANMAISWLGDDVYFRLKARPNYDTGAAQTLSIPARPETPAATGMDETSFGQGDGSISGVSAAMEYKAGADGSWQNGTGAELTGLTAGTYYIRVKATEKSFKSLEQEIILQNGPKLTVNFDGQGGSAVDSCTDLSYGALLPQPAAPTREGYAFAGWYKESALENAWHFETDRVTANITVWAKWTRNPDDSAGTVPQEPKTITVTETSSSLFIGSEGQISASAYMDKAFASSVEVKVTDTQEDKASYGFAAGDEVYPFDISLYIKGTNEKTEPAAGYSVTISLPVPASLMDVKELVSVVHKSGSGAVTTLASRLEQKNGAWYLTFEATEFSPYALVVRSAGNYDESAGVPYYLDAKGSRVFIGFSANGRYIAPEGVSVYVTQNGKSFTDVSRHWAQSYIGFVTERELFLGTGGNAFSPDTGMTRAMFATVVGRLYERSYGEINAPNTHAFTDCDYSGYYGRYVDWAAKNAIIGGYGNGVFGPDDSITREQMAAILYRFANFLRVLPNDMDAALNYPDAGSVSSYAKNAALYCQTTRVIGGRTGGVFAPQETATRAEVATIIERFVESVVK